MSTKKSHTHSYDPEGYRKWVDESITDLFFQKKTTDITKIKNNYNVAYGPAPRYAYFKMLKLTAQMSSTEVITTAFKLSDPEIPNSEIIFALLYSEPRKTVTSGTYLGTEKLIHQLVCISASLLSRDGEYRQRLIPASVIKTVFEQYPEIYQDMHDHVQKKVDKYKWNIFSECFYPTNESKEYAEELESNVAGSNFAMSFLTACWFVEFINIYKNQKINHINKLFKVIFKFKDKSVVREDSMFIDQIYKKYGEEDMYYIYNRLNCYNPSVVKKPSNVKFGQKIIPLNLSEMQNPFNIRYKPWREYLISEKIQSLIINGICSGLPMLGDYFFIRNTRKTLFDNYVQYMKMEHSDQAIGITRKLIDAQRGTFKPSNNDGYISLKPGNNVKSVEQQNKDNLINKYKDDKDDPDSPDSAQEIEEWLSNKFRELHDKIKDPIEYAREEIIMSEMSLCVTSEYAGRTFYDAINICLDNESYANDMGNPYENYDIWAKHIFELIYTLYCLNSRKGVIHGDLHLNNFTIQPQYFTKFRDVTSLKNPHMLFILDDNHLFAFPTRQYHTVVIDFSRAIVRPSLLDSFENFDIVHAKKLKLKEEGKIQLLRPEERSEFLYEQVIRILKFYEMYFPDFTVPRKSSLSVLLLNNFDKLFPIFSGMDTYLAINNTILFFRKTGLDKKHLKHFKLLEGIVNRTEQLLTDTLEKIIEDPKSVDYSIMQYTNRKLLDEFFSEYLIISPENNNLTQFLSKNTTVGIDFYENKEIYNFDNVNNFPNYLLDQKYYGIDGKLYEGPIGSGYKEYRKFYEKRKAENLNIISEIAGTYANKLF